MNDSMPWLKMYPAGVPVNINPDQFVNLNAFCDHVFEAYGNKPAFSCMGTTLTYKQVDQMSRQFAGYLQMRGLRPGDRLALMMPNLLQYPIAIIGAIRAGIVIVNTNPLYTPREMEHQFKDSGAKAILIVENFCYNLEKIIAKTEIQTIITTSIGELLGSMKGSVVNFMVRNVKRMVPKYNLTNTVTFKQAIKEGKKFTAEPGEVNADDVAFLQYTGGTTGISKGAMLTHKNVVANVLQIKAMLSNELDEDPVILCPLPMYHIFALVVNLFAGLLISAHSVLIVNPRDLNTIVKAFNTYPISMMTGVNTLYNALANFKAFQSLDFSKLKICSGGGTAVQQAVAEHWQEVTGVLICEGYGLTEASPVVSCNPADGSARIGYIGLPVPSTNVRVADESDNVLGVGEVGEIQVQGPQVMKGYYNRPKETADTFSADGWLKTGDIGKMEEDGFFKIVDRKKDMILVSGFNVYPNEIEDVVAKHPKVLEAAAVGIPHEKSGECVKLFVVKKDNSLNEEEIIQYCRENLTGYKVPKEIEFKKDLPKSTVGKILRRELRDST
jgi:long-chain acyl-CoA synthetase